MTEVCPSSGYYTCVNLVLMQIPLILSTTDVQKRQFSPNGSTDFQNFLFFCKAMNLPITFVSVNFSLTLKKAIFYEF